MSYISFSSPFKCVLLLVAGMVMGGCSAKVTQRDSCANQLNAAWNELSIAEVEGFAGTVSYSKAVTLLTAAKTQQQFEGYRGCTQKAQKARFYIRESRAGR